MRRRTPRSALLVVALIAAAASQAAAQPEEFYPPVSAYVDTSDLPSDVLAPAEEDDPATTEVDEGDALRNVRVKEFLYSEIQNAAEVDIGARIRGTVVISEDVRLAIPGLDALELVLAKGEINFEVQAREEPEPTGDSWPFYVKLEAIPLRLRVTGDFLRPLDRKPDGTLVELPTNAAGQPIDADGDVVHADLVNTVTLIVRRTWDGESEIVLEGPGGGIPSFAFARPVMFGQSGIVLDVKGARVDLSDTQSPAPNAANPAWRGVVFESLSVEFTNGLEVPKLASGPGTTPSRPEVASIALTNFSIGTGGVTGTISGTVTGELVVDLAGMELELTSIDVQLQQNAITGIAIGGVLRQVPFFERDVKVVIGFDLDGNFKIGVAPDDPSRNAAGILVWTIDDVLDLEIRAIAFERKEHVFLLRIDGTIVPRFFAPGEVDKDSDQDARIDVNGLTITSEGQVSLAGGWVDLPAKRYLNFHAFRAELAQIGFGAEPGGQKWIGFSGGIELVKGLSAKAKFEKLTFAWPRKDGTPGVDVALSGIEVGFRQPGVVGFEGAVDWFDEGGAKGFGGAIKADLEFIKTSIAGRLVIGQKTPAIPASNTGTCPTVADDDPFKFFYIDFDANLPAGIPVFSNVSIYGVSGLFAYNLTPNLCAFDRPLEWFVAHKNATNVVGGSPPPWVPRDDAAAFGLGVLLGTTSDDGYAINSKVALTVALPGPLVMLTGTGNILRERPGLTEGPDPLFDAIAVYDGTKETFLLNLGIYYKFPGGGQVIDLAASAEAYFNLNDPGDWHLWLGQKTPESRRIQAKILKFFSASAYWMLDPAQLAFGARAGYSSSPKWKFGPLKVRLGAHLGVDAVVSWRPFHVWGSADLGGEAELSAFGFGVGVGVHAVLEVTTPSPYMVDGDFEVKLKLPWPLPDPKAHVHLHWEEAAEKEPLDQLVTAVSVESSKALTSVAADVDRATTMAAGTTRPIGFFCEPWESLPAGTLDDLPAPSCTGRPMVPVDWVPVIAFGRDTNESLTGPDQPTLVGNSGSYADVIDDTTFAYHLRSLKVWSAPKHGTTVTFNGVLEDVYGAWPALLGGPLQPAALYVKLWSKNPFAIYEASTLMFWQGGKGGWSDWFHDRYPQWPCPRKPPPGIYDWPAKRCKGDGGLLIEDALILPPYHAFALALESDVLENNVLERSYRDVSWFHTEGAPLDLAPYVHVSIPEGIARPHYRDYDVGLRFNETFIDLLYSEAVSADELLYKSPDQRLEIEIVDETEAPLRDARGDLVPVTARWEHALDHIATRTDQEWLDLLAAQGFAIDPSDDDVVYGRPDWTGGLRADTRYLVRVWFYDPRLAGDARLGDDAWLRANPVRRIDGTSRVLVYEFPIVASGYASFAELFGTYEGRWWRVDAPAFDETTLAAILAEAVSRTPPPGSTLDNGDPDWIARHLAHATTLDPDALAPGALEAALLRVPAYQDDPALLDEPARTAILSAWRAELTAESRLLELVAPARAGEPPPLQVELDVVHRDGAPRGFLIEVPEAVDWSRVSVVLRHTALAAPPLDRAHAVVLDPGGLRAWIFDLSSGSSAPLDAGTYSIELTYHRDNGARNAVLAAPDGAATETVTLTAELPDGSFPGAPP
jgi:hypothetical protein